MRLSRAPPSNLLIATTNLGNVQSPTWEERWWEVSPDVLGFYTSAAYVEEVSNYTTCPQSM